MKTFIVTGASRGIGLETVRFLAEQNHQVIAIARSKEALANLKEFSKNITTLAVDLTSSSAMNKINSKLQGYSNIDGLINNAGMLLNKPFLETPIEEWKQLFEVNLFSVVELIKTVHPYLKKGSHILNISSMGGFQGSDKFPGLSAYSTSKGALSILTESLSVEFSGDGIAVNCLCLGAVQTQMLEEAFPGFEAPVQATQMGHYIADFIISGQQFFNGKIIPVALNNPE